MAIYSGGTIVADATNVQAPRLTGNLPAISGASLTGLPAASFTVADHYYLNASTTAGTNGIVGDSGGAGSTWVKNHASYSDTTAVTTGSGGGLFTYPVTGTYLVLVALQFYNGANDNDWAFRIEYTNNDWSSDSDAGYSRCSINSTGTPNNYLMNTNQYLLSVTDVSNDAFRVTLNTTAALNYVYGAAEALASTLQILRIGDSS